jgi:hypothetical protein
MFLLAGLLRFLCWKVTPAPQQLNVCSCRLALLFNASNCGLDRIQSLTVTCDGTARRIKRNVG